MMMIMMMVIIITIISIIINMVIIVIIIIIIIWGRDQMLPPPPPPNAPCSLEQIHYRNIRTDIKGHFRLQSHTTLRRREGVFHWRERRF